MFLFVTFTKFIKLIIIILYYIIIVYYKLIYLLSFPFAFVM